MRQLLFATLLFLLPTSAFAATAISYNDTRVQTAVTILSQHCDRPLGTGNRQSAAQCRKLPDRPVRVLAAVVRGCVDDVCGRVGLSRGA